MGQLHVSQEIVAHPPFVAPRRLAARRGLAWQVPAKRLLDLAVAVPAFLLLLPFFGLIALLIKLDSPGPVFHVQQRLGRGKRLFPCLKFRTMHVDGDDLLTGYLDSHPAQREEWLTYKKLKDDPRVTWVGRYLRKMTLDEAPQVLNVICGQMSIVGPRPYLPRELADIPRDRQIVFAVRPGMAGIWVVKGRNDLTFRERVALEASYVANWSLWRDCALFGQSFVAVLLRKGVH